MRHIFLTFFFFSVSVLAIQASSVQRSYNNVSVGSRTVSFTVVIHNSDGDTYQMELISVGAQSTAGSYNFDVGFGTSGSPNSLNNISRGIGEPGNVTTQFGQLRPCNMDAVQFHVRVGYGTNPANTTIVETFQMIDDCRFLEDEADVFEEYIVEVAVTNPLDVETMYLVVDQATGLVLTWGHLGVGDGHVQRFAMSVDENDSERAIEVVYGPRCENDPDWCARYAVNKRTVDDVDMYYIDQSTPFLARRENVPASWTPINNWGTSTPDGVEGVYMDPTSFHGGSPREYGEYTAVQDPATRSWTVRPTAAVNFEATRILEILDDIERTDTAKIVESQFEIWQRDAQIQRELNANLVSAMNEVRGVLEQGELGVDTEALETALGNLQGAIGEMDLDLDTESLEQSIISLRDSIQDPGGLTEAVESLQGATGETTTALGELRDAIEGAMGEGSALDTLAQTQLDAMEEHADGVTTQTALGNLGALADGAAATYGTHVGTPGGTGSVSVAAGGDVWPVITVLGTAYSLDPYEHLPFLSVLLAWAKELILLLASIQFVRRCQDSMEGWVQTMSGTPQITTQTDWISATAFGGWLKQTLTATFIVTAFLVAVAAAVVLLNTQIGAFSGSTGGVVGSMGDVAQGLGVSVMPGSVGPAVWTLVTDAVPVGALLSLTAMYIVFRWQVGPVMMGGIMVARFVRG